MNCCLSYQLTTPLRGPKRESCNQFGMPCLNQHSLIISHTHRCCSSSCCYCCCCCYRPWRTASLPHLGIKKLSYASKNAQCALLPRTFSRQNPLPSPHPPSKSMYSVSSSSIKVPSFHLSILSSYSLNDVHSPPSSWILPSSSSHSPKTSSTIDSHSTTTQKSPDKTIPRAPAPPS